MVAMPLSKGMAILCVTLVKTPKGCLPPAETLAIRCKKATAIGPHPPVASKHSGIYVHPNA